MPELTDLSYVRALCEKYDFALSKGFGQNFIVNPGLPPKIVDASGVDKRYGVLEIGPGIGVLTKELAKRAAKVVSIEVDERLPPLLARWVLLTAIFSWFRPPFIFIFWLAMILTHTGMHSQAH